jgi:O-antigen/teichoic acid export membrane protein
VKRTLANLSSVLGGEAAIRIANFFAMLAIARLYGSAILGLFGACLAAATVAVMFADNGLQTSAVTEFARARERSRSFLGELYVTKTVLSASALLFLAAAASLKGCDRACWMVGGAVFGRTLLQSFSQLQIAILKAVGRMRGIGAVQGVHGALLGVAVSLVLARGWPLIRFLGILLVLQALEFALMSAVVLGTGFRPAWPRVAGCLALAKRSTPFGIAYALSNLTIRLDVLVVSTLFPIAAVGQFSAANNVLLVVYLGAALTGSVLLPEMVRMKFSPADLAEYAGRWTRFLLISTVPFALLCLWLTPRMVTLLFGAAFSQAGTLAAVMLLAGPLVACNSIQMNLALASGARHAYLGVLAAAVLATLCLDYGLGYGFGLVGVTIAILVREAAIFVGFLFLRSRIAARLASAPISG